MASTRLGLGLALGVALAAGAANPQAARLAPDEVTLTGHAFRPHLVFHAAGNEVQIAAVVTGPQGAVVAGLKRGDFHVLDNGRAQTLTAFAVDVRATPPATPGAAPGPAASVAGAAAPPRSVAFLLDDLDTQPDQLGDLGSARAAAAAFLQGAGDQLPSGLEAAVYTTSGTNTVAFTSRRAPLLAALAQIQPRSRTGSEGCPLMTPYEANQILHDDADALALAIAQAQSGGCICMDQSASRCAAMVQDRARTFLGQCEEQSQFALDALEAAVADLSARPGERVLLLASSGFATPDLQAGLSQAVDRALRAGVVVNALDAKGLVAPNRRSSPDDPPVANANLNAWRDTTASAARELMNAGMAQLAGSTGGRFIENTNGLAAAVQTLAQAPAVTYRLAYSPVGLVADGSLHRLEVNLTAPGHFQVQARRAYAAPPKPGSVLELQDALNQAALAADAPRALPMHVAMQEQIAAGTRTLHVAVMVEAQNLPFVRSGGRNQEQISVVAVLSDDHGAFVAGEQAEMNLHLTDASRQRVSQPGVGLDAGLTLAAPPGHYHLRIVAQESVKGRLSAATTGLTLR